MKNILFPIGKRLKKIFIFLKNKPFLVLIIFFTLALAVLLILIIKTINKSPSSLNSGSNTSSGDDTAKTLEKVKMHLVLPSEEPKIVPLVNVEILKKDQPFFALAKDGDKLIIYNKKVILYDPVIDRIVDIAQIRISPPISSAPLPSNIPAISITIPKPTEELKKYKISMYLATDSTQTEKKAKDAIKQLSQFEIAQTGKSKSTNYRNNIVVNLKGAQDDITTKLTKALSATSSSIPKSETAPSSNIDFLVIISK
jgi:hypothetical protein